jgi:hypothetical protein
MCWIYVITANSAISKTEKKQIGTNKETPLRWRLCSDQIKGYSYEEDILLYVRPPDPVAAFSMYRGARYYREPGYSCSDWLPDARHRRRTAVCATIVQADKPGPRREQPSRTDVGTQAGAECTST